MEIYSRIIFIIILVLGNNLYAEELEESKFDNMAKDIVNGICGIEDYISCLNISKADCSNTFYSAIEACPRLKPKYLDYEVVDAPCSTVKFFEIQNLPDNLVIKCDFIIKEMVNNMEAELKMPNYKLNQMP